MSRIPTPATIDAAPASAQSVLEAVKQQFGVVPNLFRLVASSPAALEGHLGLSGALHIALNTWTNYINEVAQTDIDFPAVAARRAA